MQNAQTLHNATGPTAGHSGVSAPTSTPRGIPGLRERRRTRSTLWFGPQPNCEVIKSHTPAHRCTGTCPCCPWDSQACAPPAAVVSRSSSALPARNHVISCQRGRRLQRAAARGPVGRCDSPRATSTSAAHRPASAWRRVVGPPPCRPWRWLARGR